MSKHKIFILLPDGIGLRNFAYSSFHGLGKKHGFDICYWNNTPFSLTDLGFQEIKIQNSRSHPLTDIYKNARKQVELNINRKKSNDSVYDTYRFPFSYETLKIAVKSVAIQLLSWTHSSEKGLQKIRKKIREKERETLYYCQSKETLQREQPAMVFCTNQRPMTAIAPLLAAQDLGITTVTFIFSWDNLPKATMVIETDYYFVWSDQMKKELLFYCPYIKVEQVIVTGTPQFESHFDLPKLLSREMFFEENRLDLKKKYICYSGDDMTTCPDDPKYLEDLAIAVLELNKKGHSLGIIFRRCPVDFSSRFNGVLAKYKNIIVSISPVWERKGESWNSILPTQEDIILQMNTITYTEMVVNLGSSMVFDYAAYNKACAYINYDVENKVLPNWSVKKIYNFVHFRSMPNATAVVWLNNKDEIASKIEIALKDSKTTVNHAKNWFEVINLHPPQDASKRIWDEIKNIVECEKIV
jgi:hypothetical protein